MLRSFERSLEKLFSQVPASRWREQGKTPRLGLAISGGVDSIALASLCSQTPRLASSERESSTAANASFTAFIVDHKLRRGSSEEAQYVAAEMKKLNIDPCILELDWHEHGEPSLLSNVESIARRLRYQALGKACREKAIKALLVAHHADDQAETVMTRMVANYMGVGLAGINPVSAIPECEGIYGVNESGSQRFKSNSKGHASTILTESGGVIIYRPLLAFKKHQLVDFCKKSEVRWFDDHTNLDPRLTIRNTVRHLQKEKVLPMALQTARLLDLAGNMTRERAQRERHALTAFRELPLQLDLRVGKLEVSVIRYVPNSLAAELLRMIIATVAPKETIALRDLGWYAEKILTIDGAKDDASANTLQISGTAIRRDSLPKFSCPTLSLQRALPTRKERVDMRLALVSAQNTSMRSWTDWRLWDSRYWIRIYTPSQKLQGIESVFVRFLDKEDIAGLRNQIPNSQVEKLDESLTAAKRSIRFTLPAITFQGDLHSPEHVVALPSLGWSVEGWKHYTTWRPADEDSWMWDIRYKHIELSRRHLQEVRS